MKPPQLKRALFGYSRNSVMAMIADRDQLFVKASEKARQAEARAAELEKNLRQAVGKLAPLSEQLEEATAEAEKLRAEREELSQRAQRSDDDAAKMSRLELDAQSARADAVGIETRLRDAEHRVNELTAELESMGKQLQQTKELADASIVVSVSDAPSTAEELSGALQAAEHAVSRIVEAARVRGEEELKDLERTRAEIAAEMDRLTAWREAFVPAVQDLKRWVGETRQQTMDLSDRIREAMGPASTVLEGLTDRLQRLSDLPELSEATVIAHALDAKFRGSSDSPAEEGTIDLASEGEDEEEEEEEDAGPQHPSNSAQLRVVPPER